MVSNTQKNNIFLIFRLFSRESSCNSQNNEHFYRAKVLSNIYGKIREISVFRGKSDEVIKFRSRDPMKHIFSKSPYARVYLC